MRAEEGDESISDYADEAQEAQRKVSGPSPRRWLRKLLRFTGFGSGKQSRRGGQHQ